MFPLFFYELLLCYAYLCGNNRLKAIKFTNMKTKLLASMLVFGAMNASAQLTVYHNGNVNIGSEQPTSNVSLSVGNVAYSDTAYHVSLGSCQVCLSKFENNNLVYYKIVNFDKVVDLADVPNDVTVCITKYGYIPYTMYVLDGDLVYLQNRNIDSDAKITGTEIIAGSHVDSNQPAGSVTIRRGQAILETKNGAIIKNDFKVFKGGAMRVITKK